MYVCMYIHFRHFSYEGMTSHGVDLRSPQISNCRTNGVESGRRHILLQQLLPALKQPASPFAAGIVERRDLVCPWHLCRTWPNHLRTIWDDYALGLKQGLLCSAFGAVQVSWCSQTVWWHTSSGVLASHSSADVPHRNFSRTNICMHKALVPWHNYQRLFHIHARINF